MASMAIDVSSSHDLIRSQDSLIQQDRVEPYSFDAEQALLGGLLLNPESFSLVYDIVPDAEAFYYEQHRLIYTAMCNIVRQSHNAIELLSLKLELERNQHLSKIGGIPYLQALQNASPKSLDLTPYARTVANKAQCRKLLKACADITESIYSPHGLTTNELLDLAESKMFAINEQSITAGVGPQEIYKAIAEVVTDIRKLENIENNDVTGIDTGFADLNVKTSGFHAGQLIIVAARPAMGKTTFAMNLVENIAIKPDTAKPALVFSLEMSTKELAARMISSLARVEQNKIRNAKLDTNDWTNVFGVLRDIDARNKKKAIYVDDQSSLTPFDIRSRARRLAKEHGGLSVIMVDYLQLMRAPGFGENRALEVAECSRSLKALAKELQVPVIALAQLNRGLEGRKDKRPMPSDLRESGSIEQDADVILFVHREEVFNQNDPSLEGKAEIIIGKNRSGETGIINMIFQKKFSRFELEAYADDPNYVPPLGQ